MMNEQKKTNEDTAYLVTQTFKSTLGGFKSLRMGTIKVYFMVYICNSKED